MPVNLRTRILAAVSAIALAACAADPAGRSGPAGVVYRGATPSTKPVEVGPAIRSAPPAASAARNQPPIRTAPVVTDQGPPSVVPAVAEAASLKPEASGRPGGALRQPKDSVAARRIPVQKGDRLYDISRRYTVNMRALIETNKLQPPYALDPGADIYLPPPNIHVVERGETLYSVSRRYNVDTRSLALLNGLARPWTVWPGDELLLPPLARDAGQPVDTAAAQKPAPPPKVALVAKAARPVVVAGNAAPPEADIPPAAAPKPVAAVKAARPPVEEAPSRVASSTSGAFIWPISGPILKAFGANPDGQRNDGVNIGADQGSDVKAAAAGEVVYAGNELSGFGNLILLRHADGWVSAYAHADSLLVKEGQKVAQGQAIAKAGATGSASSPQVHFELRRGKNPVDPSQYLPALRG